MISENNKIRISEIFCSIQGEGIYTGTPSVFVRFQGCHNNCAWCDTSFSWDKNLGQEMTVQEVLSKIFTFKNIYHIVITGGESTNQLEGLTSLVHYLYYDKDGRKFTTVETNGTINPFDSFSGNAACVDLWSISPKLQSAKAKLKYNISAISQMLYYNSQLKFVVSDEADIIEMFQLLNTIRFLNRPVIIQPNGQDKGITCSSEEYSTRADWLINILLSKYITHIAMYDIRIMLQQHKVVWGNKRGV